MVFWKLKWMWGKMVDLHLSLPKCPGWLIPSERAEKNGMSLHTQTWATPIRGQVVVCTLRPHMLHWTHSPIQWWFQFPYISCGSCFLGLLKIPSMVRSFMGIQYLEEPATPVLHYIYINIIPLSLCSLPRLPVMRAKTGDRELVGFTHALN